MQEKEKFLQESVSKQSELEQKLFNLNLMEFKQKQENERLLKVIFNLPVICFFLYNKNRLNLKGKSSARKTIKRERQAFAKLKIVHRYITKTN